MKTIITKRVIPPEPEYEVEDKTFACDVPGCDYTNDDGQYAHFHYGEKHALAETKEIRGETFYRFASDADMHEWWDAYDRDEGYKEQKPRGSGPGWYTIRGETRPCGRSCCSNYHQWLITAEERLRDLQSERDGLSRFIGTLSEILPAQYDHPDAPRCVTCGIELTDGDDIYAEGAPNHANAGCCIGALREKLGIWK
jgi:hypothetical protein